MSEHNMQELVESADARVGSHVHFEVVDEVRCRLVATQLAIGEKLDLTQSTTDGGKALAGTFVLMRTMFTHLVVAFQDLSVVFHRAKVAELVYVHPRRGTCQREYHS